MTELSLFTQMKLKGGPVCSGPSMSPEIFEAATPAFRSEAVRLMVEAGYGAGVIEQLTGRSRKDLQAIGRENHAIKAFLGDRYPGEPHTRKRKAKVDTVSATGRLVLGHMVSQAGMLCASVNSLSYDLGISQGAVKDAIRRLLGSGHIERVGEGEDRRVCVYRLTDSGDAVSGYSAEAADA